MGVTRITVLTMRDCPHVPVVRDRITAALDGREVAVKPPCGTRGRPPTPSAHGRRPIANG
ncbi:hypothetical protein ACFT7S_27405 [Streptomyces sp. NPDC057136]|uniref:hypothetical protein n=1 Tax=Streptomyces sp. NPDC057136 TaxID=3346029 RepID=UPI00363F3E20